MGRVDDREEGQKSVVRKVGDADLHTAEFSGPVHEAELQAGHARRVIHDPDRSARLIRDSLIAATGKSIGVLVIDSFGRAWRLGTCGICIGAAGVETIQDLRGQRDLLGRQLQSTIVGRGDELAAAASLLMGQANEGRPMVVIRGLPPDQIQGSAADLVRPLREDLFP